MMMAMGDSKREWPAESVEMRSLASLVPYARNARIHSERQVAQIAASIREWGWTVPVLVDEEGTIIAGHGRVMAAQKMGIESVPTMIARGWTEAQRRAYVIADNQIAINAAWDDDMLRIEMDALRELDFDTDLVGLDLSRLQDLDDGKGLDESALDDIRLEVVIECEGEDHQAEVIELAMAKGWKCRALS